MRKALIALAFILCTTVLLQASNVLDMMGTAVSVSGVSTANLPLSVTCVYEYGTESHTYSSTGNFLHSYNGYGSLTGVIINSQLVSVGQWRDVYLPSGDTINVQPSGGIAGWTGFQGNVPIRGGARGR